MKWAEQPVKSFRSTCRAIYESVIKGNSGWHALTGRGQASPKSSTAPTATLRLDSQAAPGSAGGNAARTSLRHSEASGNPRQSRGLLGYWVAQCLLNIRTCAICIALCFGIAAANSVAATVDPMDWPNWRGPQQNRVSTEKGLIDHWDPNGGPGSNLLWKKKELGGRSTPVVF